jgi:hypothetical protein
MNIFISGRMLDAERGRDPGDTRSEPAMRVRQRVLAADSPVRIADAQRENAQRESDGLFMVSDAQL